MSHFRRDELAADYAKPIFEPKTMIDVSREAAFKAGWNAAVKEEWDEIRKWKPFLHWCRDWDFLLIDKGDPEFEACTCFPDSR